MALKILLQCGKKIKIKSQKVLGGNLYVYDNCRGKTDKGGPFEPPPSLNMVQNIFKLT